MQLVRINEIYDENTISKLAVMINEVDMALKVKTETGELSPNMSKNLTRFSEKCKRDLVELKNNSSKVIGYDFENDKFDTSKGNGVQMKHAAMKSLVNLHKQLSRG
jgi:hypothetical protein